MFPKTEYGSAYPGHVILVREFADRIVNHTWRVSAVQLTADQGMQAVKDDCERYATMTGGHTADFRDLAWQIQSAYMQAQFDDETVIQRRLAKELADFCDTLARGSLSADQV